MGSERSLHMEPSPLPVLRDSSSEELAPDAPPRPAAEGMEELDRVYSWTLWSSFLASRPETGAPQCFYPFEVRTQEETECVRGRLARSPTNICQRGATSKRPGGRHTSYRVGSQPERARHTLCLISHGDGIHYPVGHPLLGGGIPFLLASVTDKSWSEVLKLRVLST